jgi:hypothetical protein
MWVCSNEKPPVAGRFRMAGHDGRSGINIIVLQIVLDNDIDDGQADRQWQP